MQRTTELPSTSLGAPSKGPDVQGRALDPLTSKADLAYQRAELAVTTYATAPAGSARRELFDRLSQGEDVDRVSGSLLESRGLQVPGEDRQYLKEYQAKHLLNAPRIELDTTVLAQVRNPSLDRAPGVYATPANETQRSQRLEASLSPAQAAAVEGYKVKLNTGLSQAAATLGQMEAKGLRGTDEYRKVLETYQKLEHAAMPTGGARAMALTREQALKNLETLKTDPEKMARTSPQLLAHYETASRGGGPAAGPNLGTGVPKPSVEGRFAGMENPKDLPMNREMIARVALTAEPGGPNANLLAAQLRVPPKDLGIDHAALQKMWDDRRAEVLQHRQRLDSPISEAPQAPRPLAERVVAAGPVDLANPPFKASGPSVPAEPLPDRTFGDTSKNQTAGPGGPSGEGPQGGGDGPGGGGPEGKGAGPAPSSDPTARYRSPGISPEAHGAKELERQIQEIEKAAQVRMRTAKIIAAATVVGTVTSALAEVAMEVGTAPMNPNANPGRALGSVGRSISTSGREMGNLARQVVHERTKADADIRQALTQHASNQRQNAEEWAEKMSNQMEHLEALGPDVKDLDKAERIIAADVMEDPGFKAGYEMRRDANAYDLHMAAAEEMTLSSNEELQKTGAEMAKVLRDNPDLKKAGWEELQSQVSTAATRQGIDGATFDTYVREMEAREHASAVQARTREIFAQAAKEGRLGDVIGDQEIAGRLMASSKLSDPNNRMTPAEALVMTLDQKHGIERSIQASWRDFQARSPIHAERVVQGGMDPARQLNHLYGRPVQDAVNETTERAAMRGLRDYFSEQATWKVGQGNLGEMRQHLGVPRGWGDNTVAGSRVGVAASQNGGTQALLVGFREDSNQMDQAALHLFAKEGVAAPASDLQKMGVDPVAFNKVRPVVPPPTAHVFIAGEDVRRLDVNKLSDKIAKDYNAAVTAGFRENASNQLKVDAYAFAGLRTSGTPIKVGANLSPEQQELVKLYVAKNQDGYERRGETLAAREAISGPSARAMASQLKEAASAGGYNQLVEANRGHFNFPPHPAAIDPDPRKALEGKGGDGIGRDFRRMMAQADQVYLDIPDQIRRARDGGINIVKEKDFLYQVSPKTAQAKALLDTPLRQSQTDNRGQVGAAYNKDAYDAALAFLRRKGYGPEAPNQAA